MDDAERLELLESLIEELNAVAGKCIILVEGANDAASLRAAGVAGTFRCVQSTGGPVRAAEHVWLSGREAVVLTDWDRRGDSLAESLAENLASLDVRFDASIRKRMASVCRPFCKDVESVHSVKEMLRFKASY